jgi:hypothetical protein
MRYQVVVSGSIFFETTDELLAREYARLTRATGWNNVTVREVLL